MDDLELIKRSSNFTVLLLSREDSRKDERTHYGTHDTVLIPLLSVADECWVYGIEPGSAVSLVAAPLLQKEGRRHRVLLSGDPVTNYEFFWNAHSGKRGS